MYENKYMQLVQVLKNKAKRAKEKIADLETIVNGGAASANQKQEYVTLKAKLEAYEDVIDLAEGMIEDKN